MQNILLSETENLGTPDKQHDPSIMYYVYGDNGRTHFLRRSARWWAWKTGRVPCCWMPVLPLCTPCTPLDRPRPRLRCCTGNWCWWSSRCNGRAAATTEPPATVSWRSARPRRQPAGIRRDNPTARRCRPPMAAVPTWPTAPSYSWPRPAHFAAPWWALKIHIQSEIFIWLIGFYTVLRACVTINNTKAWVFRLEIAVDAHKSPDKLPITLQGQ